MKTSIIGIGWVGTFMKQLFPDSVVYSRNNGDKNGVNKCDVAFICVPTPLVDGKLDTSIVEEVISWCECPLIVVRSTVNPGDCDRWSKEYNKHICMQPEYLGETPAHPMLDPKTRNFLIIGGEPKDRKTLIDLYATVYNSNITIRQVSLLESEVIKLSENRAIGFKVMQLHELYLACEKANLDYYTIRDAVYGDDPRFNLWFSFIYPNKLGFNNSKCLAKDIPAWCSWAESVGANADITKLLVRKSNEYAVRNNPS
jgi:UDPglucose 6-dehydrogenase